MNTEEQIFLELSEHTRQLLRQGQLLSLPQIIEWLKYEFFIEQSAMSETFAERLKNWHRLLCQSEFIDEEIERINAKQLTVDEVVFHHHQLKTYATHQGHQVQTSTFSWSADDYQLALEILAFRHGQSWNVTRPFTSFALTLKDTPLRLTLIHKAASPGASSKLFVRIQRQSIPELTSFAPLELCTFLQEAVLGQKNMLIAGATGSGKTTLLQSLLQHVPQAEHCLIIEDTAEIQHHHPLTTSLLASDLPGHHMNDFCAYAMRMRPDRLILGEMRSKEVIPFMLALNTGHRGMMATLHANSSQEVFRRLGTLFSLYQEGSTPISYHTVVELIARNIDFVIFMKNKKIVEVIKLFGVEGDRPLFDQVF